MDERTPTLSPRTGRAKPDRCLDDLELEAPLVETRSPCEHCGAGQALVLVRWCRSDAVLGVAWTLTLASILLIPFTADGAVYTFGLIEELRGPVEEWRYHLVALSPIVPVLTLVACIPLLRRHAVVECRGCGVRRARDAVDRSVLPPLRPVAADRVAAEPCFRCGCRAIRKRPFGWRGLMRGFFGMIAVILGVLALNIGIPSVLYDLAAGAPPKFPPGGLTPLFVRVLVVPGALATLVGVWLLAARWLPSCARCGAPRVRGS